MRVRTVAVGVAFVAVAFLSAACGNKEYASSQETQPKIQAAANTSEDVNCSEHGGQVGPVGGKQVDLIAVATSAGTVGCEEAFNVIDAYYQDAPTKSEGTGHYLTVQGWNCMTDTGAQGTGTIGCDKDGLAFHTN